MNEVPTVVLPYGPGGAGDLRGRHFRSLAHACAANGRDADPGRRVLRRFGGESSATILLVSGPRVPDLPAFLILRHVRRGAGLDLRDGRPVSATIVGPRHRRTVLIEVWVLVGAKQAIGSHRTSGSRVVAVIHRDRRASCRSLLRREGQPALPGRGMAAAALVGAPPFHTAFWLGVDVRYVAQWMCIVVASTHPVLLSSA